ncbi:polysaccharide lyase [Filimonas effusa]|uniref:polysaccharide lyase n=1 Tax=Filimonas effusa TaxID=2508721 RepID=UPI001C704EE6|nr:polysaccharide lyase [Filimonas effusa]
MNPTYLKTVKFRRCCQVLVLATVCGIQSASAQYPKIPQAAAEASKAVMDAASRHSDSAWQKAWPIIQEEARHGKPYSPWAHRPTDLPQARIAAFPGAEGGGKYSFGGRGGKVFVVTNLNDDGPGSLRYACEQGGARTVVFNVAGIIRLKTPLIIRAPYITIAGQSAPGNGVCIAGETVWINTHDVIIRYMRFRRGETFVGRRDDAIGGNPIGNIIIDHVSASWGLDENMSLYRHMYDDSTGSKEQKMGTVNLTIQHSIFSEGLDTWNHAFGSTLGGENATFMRNLWADNTGRNPSIGWNGTFNFVNNVIFNWVHRSVDGGDYTATYNMINNYYKPGPATPKTSPVGHRILKPESGRSKLAYKVFGRVYANGNIMEGFPAITKDNWAGGIQIADEDQSDLSKYVDYMRVDAPFPMAPVTITSAQEAFNYVLKNAGATLPERDPVDTRVIEQVRTGKITYLPNVKAPTTQFEHRRMPLDSYKTGILTDISQVGGYPEYKGTPYKDSDNDGIPDAWEKQHGLNPNDAKDASALSKDGSGYTNIEKFLNDVAAGKK